MKSIIYTLCIYLFGTCLCCGIYAGSYFWIDRYNDSNTIEKRVAPPDGYIRNYSDTNSYTYWMRNLPLKPKGAKVNLYNGKEKANRNAYHSVFNIDTGNKDLQQCADAVIRLRAEYLFSQNRTDEISFKFTSGDVVSLRDWINGKRPVVKGNKVTWNNMNQIDSSYSTFREYLNTIFMYCGTYSLNKELIPVDNIKDIKPGDVFIQGGFPGHAIFVVDVIEDDKKNRLCLLGQGFTPAQDIHILNNPNNPELGPWYDINFGNILRTPEWTFKKTDLKKFDEH